MYTYQYNNDATIYEPNGHDPVPNVMTEEAQNMGGVQLQQGGIVHMTDAQVNDVTVTAPNTIPIYAVDSSVPLFEIPDQMQRRSFVRKVFVILLLQNIVVVAGIELCLLFIDAPLSWTMYSCCWLLNLCIFAMLYVFSDARRYPPMNVLGLLVVTLLWVLQESAHATLIGTHKALLSQAVIVVQLFALVVYSKQQRFTFSNMNAILLMLFVFVLTACIVGIVSPESVFALTIGSALNTVYFVYDMHLMLSGYHGYNLQPEEHIFAAANIYADAPNLLWRFFKYILLDRIVNMYHFFSDCCSAEVC